MLVPNHDLSHFEIACKNFRIVATATNILQMLFEIKIVGITYGAGYLWRNSYKIWWKKEHKAV